MINKYSQRLILNKEVKMMNLSRIQIIKKITKSILTIIIYSISSTLLKIVEIFDLLCKIVVNQLFCLKLSYLLKRKLNSKLKLSSIIINRGDEYLIYQFDY